jgi:hypothetical protein
MRVNKVIPALAVLAAVAGCGPAKTPANTTTNTTAAGSASSAPVPPATAGSAPVSNRIDAATLNSATLPVPAWPTGMTVCASGPVRFADGHGARGGNDPEQSIKDVIYVDVDKNGSEDTVVRLECFMNDESASQVVVYVRDAAGSIRLFAPVFATNPKVRSAYALRAGTGGTVEVEVGDQDSHGEFQASAQRQWRGYGWDGGAFHQVSGPTSFPSPARSR